VDKLGLNDKILINSLNKEN